MNTYILNMPEEFKTKDGATLGYFTAGNRKKPVLFFHNGLACNPVIFLHIMNRFKKDFYIVYLAHRGHCGSDLGKLEADDLSIELLVRDAFALMNKLKIKKAIHVGFSMGVQVCFEFYKQHPEACQGFIVMGGTAGKIFQGRPGNKAIEVMLIPFLQKLLQDYHKEIQTAWQRSNIFDFIGWGFRFIGDDGPRLDKKDVRNLFRHFAVFEPKIFLSYGRALTEQDAHMVLPEIDLPVIIFGGDQDTFVPLSHQQKLHRQIEGSVLVEFKKASHLFPLSYREEINAALEVFFQTHNFRKGIF